MRRDSNDLEWQKVKKIVADRDKGQDQLLKVLSIREALLLKKLAPRNLLTVLDPAHILEVSTHPSLIYNPDNIVTLNRYSHSNLDTMRDPITAEPITREEQIAWWKRIAGSRWSALDQ